MLKMILTGCFLAFSMSGVALAHFGMVIPSASTVTEKKDAALSVDISFTHPMEMQGMPMEKPKSVKVLVNGKAEDVTASLKPSRVAEHEAWNMAYMIKRPGVYQIVMEPAPYWEPAEECYIVHSTKTFVAAFGEEEGWDEPAGLKTEIVPLTRPFGNYAGNVFQGQVLLNGKPVPGATVEIERYNKDRKYEAPNDYMVTQVVKADMNGVFTYAVPFAGWWGFAALSTAEWTIKKDGEEKPVEIGAVYWVHATAM